MNGNRGQRFLVDAMLGNIVSWLRILGYDSEYWDGDDGKLVQKALEEDRIILTKDRELYVYSMRCGVQAVLIDGDNTAQILGALNRKNKISLEFDPEYTRCPACNHLLQRNKGVFRDEWICSNCGKRYWMGRHWKNITRILEEAKKIGRRS
ncbi:MAG: Mut7-C RNAse domain-containing protein [Nitrososphaerota archaeon]